MHWFIYPDRDATIYKNDPNQNTGIDEIIEISKRYIVDGTIEVSRALVRFDLSGISASIASNDITNPTFYLNCSVSEENEIPLSYTIITHAVSQSWEMGVGTRFDKISTAGVSWNYRTSMEDTGSIWVPKNPSGSIVFAPNTTGSSDGRGGTWYTGSGFEATQSFEYESGNLRIDVTPIINNWLSGSISNDGFIIKHTTGSENDNIDYGSIKFFSTDTNTIYPPRLEVAWDDSSQNTGSLSELTGSDILIYMREMKNYYKDGSKIKFRVIARERYPQKTFSTTSQFLTVKYLPTGSFFYSIEDSETHEVLIPFGDTTKLSIDKDGNFFKLWTDGLQVERHYRLLYKFEKSDGTVGYFDDDYTFKLVR